MTDTLQQILNKLDRLEQRLHELDRQANQLAVANKDNQVLLDDNMRMRLNALEQRLTQELKKRRPVR